MREERGEEGGGGGRGAMRSAGGGSRRDGEGGRKMRERIWGPSRMIIRGERRREATSVTEKKLARLSVG